MVDGFLMIQVQERMQLVNYFHNMLQCYCSYTVPGPLELEAIFLTILIKFLINCHAVNSILAMTIRKFCLAYPEIDIWNIMFLIYIHHIFINLCTCVYLVFSFCICPDYLLTLCLLYNCISRDSTPPNKYILWKAEIINFNEWCYIDERTSWRKAKK